MIARGHNATLDRTDAVLVVVDVQERLAAAMDARDDVVAATARLVRAAGVFGIPLIVTRQYPQGLGDVVPELADPILDAREAVSVAVVDKTAFCCGEEPAFVEALTATGRRQAVLCGMETHICVTQTALGLLAGGYRVHVAADACCSRRAGDHSIALERMRAEGAVVTVSESVMYEACGRAGTPGFKALLGIVKGS